MYREGIEVADHGQADPTPLDLCPHITIQPMVLPLAEESIGAQEYTVAQEAAS